MLRTGRATSVDGAEIAFSEWGNPGGPPVVLIHGWLFSRAAFGRQAQGELAERCRIVAYDLRGHGETSKPQHLASYEDGSLWAADLDAVLAAVAMERPILCGWSLGGRVAAHYVFVNGPDRVSALNLVASRILQQQPRVNPPRGNLEITDTPLAEAASITTRFVRQCAHQPLSQEDLRSFVDVAMSVPLVARRGGSAWHIDYGNFFDELTLPVLVTHGARDSMTSLTAAETIAQRLRGRLSVYPDCGHMPFWEDPQRFNHELAEFAEQATRL